MGDKKTYLTTDKAGPRVAGRHVPFEGEGKIKVGYEIELTDAEADYELSQGTIVAKPDGKAKAPPKAGGEGAGDGGKSA